MKTLKRPETYRLPSLAWDGDFWTGKVQLPSWRGFQSRGGSYGSRDAEESSGEVELSLAPPSGEVEIVGPRPPAPEQLAAFWHLLDEEPALFKAVLKAAFEYYQRCRKMSWPGADGRPLGALKSPSALKRYLGLGTVHLLPVAKDGLGYIGFELGCSWDDEHGLGVMTHGRRVVELGGADSAFLEWIAEADGGEMLELAPAPRAKGAKMKRGARPGRSNINKRGKKK
jgi:hypothetical protein